MTDKPTKSSRRYPLIVLSGIVLTYFFVIAFSNRQGEAAYDAVKWQTDFEAAKVQADDESKTIMIFFTADWCGPCQQMKRNVFSNTNIADAIRRVAVPIKVDVTEYDAQNDVLSKQYQVQYLPTLVVVTADGSEIQRLEGALGAADFSNWVAKIKSPQPDN